MSGWPHAVYGDIPDDLVDVPRDAVQCSPRVPGGSVLDEMAVGSLSAIVVHAPPSTSERRTVLAHALRALAIGGRLTALAGNTKGGTRLASELQEFGCTIEDSHKRRFRIVTASRAAHLVGLDEAIAAGAARHVSDIGLWSQPGLFNWDRVDTGSQLLIDHLPALSGRGADLGCGIGVLARAVRGAVPPPHLVLIDIDRRALNMARRNVVGDGLTFMWADVRSAPDLPTGLDFIVTNPPFHDGGTEDKALGQAFISKAAAMLRPGGVLWLTANRHLPYEGVLAPLFATVDAIAQANGFKVYAARKALSPQGAAGATRKARR